MKEIFLSKRFIFPTVLIAAAYIVLAAYLMNFQLVRDTAFGSYPLSYKWNILLALLEGLSTSMTQAALVILVLTALFTGANLSLITLRMVAMRGMGTLRFMVGGSSVVAIVGSGCAMCGLPILALLGLTGSLAYLPFSGQEISIVGLVLLLIAFYSLVSSYSRELACEVKT